MKHTQWNEAQESFTDYLRRQWTQQLVREAHDALAYYRVFLPLPVFSLILDQTRYGIFDAERYSISISSRLIEQHPWDLVIEVLKHELAHALVYHIHGQDDSAHGELFQQACERLGVAPWARRATIELDPSTAMAEHRQLAADEEKLLKKVEKLLSLAGSSNEHEASLAMQRARELCARHHFESLSLRKKQDYTYVVINHQKKQIATWQWSILHILNQHFYVSSISRSLFDPQALVQHRVVDLMGTRENVQMAEYAYWFLYQKLPWLFEQFLVDKKPQPRNARNSFYMGVLRGFDEKLKQQQRDLQKSSSTWGLITSSNDRLGLERQSEADLRRFVRSRYPTVSGGSGRSLSVSEEAYSSGQERGRELTLHRGIQQGHSGAVNLLK